MSARMKSFLIPFEGNPDQGTDYDASTKRQSSLRWGANRCIDM